MSTSAISNTGLSAISAYNPLTTSTTGTTGTNGSTGSNNSNGALVNPAGQLGEQSFLQLLVAQLQNQDPLQPMDNTQYITQLAQFQSLQTLQSLQTTLESSMGTQVLSDAMGLIGRDVTGTAADGSTVSGTVKGVTLNNGDAQLDLGTTTIDLANVTKIETTTTGG